VEVLSAVNEQLFIGRLHFLLVAALLYNKVLYSIEEEEEKDRVISISSLIQQTEKSCI